MLCCGQSLKSLCALDRCEDLCPIAWPFSKKIRQPGLSEIDLSQPQSHKQFLLMDCENAYGQVQMCVIKSSLEIINRTSPAAGSATTVTYHTPRLLMPRLQRSVSKTMFESYQIITIVMCAIVSAQHPVSP